MWNEMVKDEEIVFDREESAHPGKPPGLLVEYIHVVLHFLMFCFNKFILFIYLFIFLQRTVLIAPKRKMTPMIRKRRKRRRQQQWELHLSITPSLRCGTGGGNQVGGEA